MVVVKVEHCRRLGYCARGMREFFLLHGMDWSSFVRDGVPADALAATGDDMALAAVRLAEKEQGAE